MSDLSQEPDLDTGGGRGGGRDCPLPEEALELGHSGLSRLSQVEQQLDSVLNRKQ